MDPLLTSCLAFRIFSECATYLVCATTRQLDVPVVLKDGPPDVRDANGSPGSSKWRPDVPSGGSTQSDQTPLVGPVPMLVQVPAPDGPAVRSLLAKTPEWCAMVFKAILA